MSKNALTIRSAEASAISITFWKDGNEHARMKLHNVNALPPIVHLWLVRGNLPGQATIIEGAK